MVAPPALWDKVVLVVRAAVLRSPLPGLCIRTSNLTRVRDVVSIHRHFETDLATEGRVGCDLLLHVVILLGDHDLKGLVAGVGG